MKLEIGDIKMDSDGGVNIRASTASVHTHPAQAQPVVKEPESPIVLSTSLATYAFVNTAIAFAAAFTLIFAGVPWPWVGVTMLAVQVPLALWTVRRHAEINAQRLLDDDQTSLLQHLQHASSLTVSQLQKRTNLPELRALEVVDSLLKSGAIEEDVDVETGHFIYRLSADQPVHPDQRSASERLSNTRKQRAITQEKQ